MKFSEFAKSKALAIVLTTFSIICIFGVMRIYRISYYAIFFTILSVIIAFTIPFLAEFFRKRNFYNNVNRITNELDKAYLLSEIIENPDFPEGQKFYETLKICNKSMCDKIAEYKIRTNDYQEYIEKWVHEIKTPISACKLACENKSNDCWEDLSENLDKIEKYVNQTLFYSRVSNAENDYIIKKTNLNNLVADALKSNAKILIGNGFSVKRENLDLTVLTDEKWIEFIFDQIISNSIKYKKEKPEISFSGEKQKNGVLLKIKDNGIGISKDNLPRIFEKNFTGGNGRLSNKSTGFGLYLCKKLCDKMGLEISADSVQNEFTQINIFFPEVSTI